MHTRHPLLDAHQFAEQNVIYPALVRVGLASQADHLYAEAEEAHIKVLKARMVALAHDNGAQKE